MYIVLLCLLQDPLFGIHGRTDVSVLHLDYSRIIPNACQAEGQDARPAYTKVLGIWNLGTLE